jgi:hypothetical protein
MKKKPYLAIMYLDGTYSFEEVGLLIPQSVEFFSIVYLTNQEKNNILEMDDRQFQETMNGFLSQAQSCN